MSLLSKLFKIREHSPDGDIVKPFLDHLEDLRWMLIKIAAALAVGMVIAFSVSKPMTLFLERPLLTVAPDTKLMTTAPLEGFTVSLTMAFYGGIILSFPILLFFLAEFILPALTKAEKKYVGPGIAAGFLLFVAGVSVCFTYIVPKTLQWLYQYSQDHGYEIHWTVKEYFGLVTHLCLACGLLCELPILMLVLSLTGLVSYQLLARTRPYAITIILIFVAIISPTPDPLTFITLAVPVIAIYEGSIWLVRLLERRRA